MTPPFKEYFILQLAEMISKKKKKISKMPKLIIGCISRYSFFLCISYFIQNSPKDLMVLIVVYICLIILKAGLRMFMYDFFFHNLST